MYIQFFQNKNEKIIATCHIALSFMMIKIEKDFRLHDRYTLTAYFMELLFLLRWLENFLPTVYKGEGLVITPYGYLHKNTHTQKHQDKFHVPLCGYPHSADKEWCYLFSFNKLKALLLKYSHRITFLYFTTSCQ